MQGAPYLWIQERKKKTKQAGSEQLLSTWIRALSIPPHQQQWKGGEHVARFILHTSDESKAPLCQAVCTRTQILTSGIVLVVPKGKRPSICTQKYTHVVFVDISWDKLNGAWHVDWHGPTHECTTTWNCTKRHLHLPELDCAWCGVAAMQICHAVAPPPWHSHLSVAIT